MQKGRCRVCPACLLRDAASGEAAKNANPNKTNALNAVLFEALSLSLQHASARLAAASPDGDTAADRAALSSCLGIMCRYLAGKVRRERGSGDSEPSRQAPA